MDPTPNEREDKKQLSSKRDSEENGSHASGPYPITLKPTVSPKLTKKISSAKGRLSAIRSSLLKDVEGIRSSIRKSPKLTKSKSHESIKAEEMPPKKNKSKKSKAVSLVRRLSIGKQKTQIQATEILQQDDKSESSTSSVTPSSQAPQHSVSESSLLKIEPIEDTKKPVIVRNSDVSDIVLSREHSPSPTENTDDHVLEDYLNNLVEGQPPTTLQILSPPPHSPPDSPTREHEKTESCDEENEFTEDNLSEPTMSSMIEANPERREHLYKILVIGELGTGKTSIIKRYVHQFFSQHYRATIGVDFALKLINWDANTVIRLQLWDIAGQERFGNMTRVYYKEAVGAFIVFDVTRVATFDAVVKWKMDLDAKVQLSDGSPIPCILLANKCDQQKEGLVNTPAKMDEYCKERGFAGWFETSAKENINIEEAGRALVNKILLNDKIINGNDPNKENETIELAGKATKNGSDNPTSSKFCSC